MKLPRWLEWLPLGHVESIDPADLPCPAEALAEQFHLLDVRTPAEWSQSRIHGSINVPLHRFSLSSLDLDTINKPVILYLPQRPPQYTSCTQAT